MNRRVDTSNEYIARSKRAARRVVFFAALYVLIAGAVTLAGWIADLPRLADWNGDGLAIMPNAALCSIVAGAALMLFAFRFRRPVAVLGVFVGCVGAATLFEYVTSIDLGIDQLLVYRDWGQQGSLFPRRMDPPGSMSWTLVGATLVLGALGRPRGRTRLAASCGGVAVAGIAALSLVGYLFGADELYTLPKLTTIAFQTATMLAAIGVAVVAAVPERGLAAVLALQDSGGALVRRLLVPVVVAPVLFGALRLIGQRAGLYDTAFGIAIFALLLVACLVALLLWSARDLSRAEDARRADQRALEESEHRLRSFLENSEVVAWMKDEDGRHVYLSENYQKRFGVRFADWQGKTDFELWPHDAAEQFRRNDLAVLAADRSLEVIEQAPLADGSRSWWRSSKFTFRDASGRRFVGGLGVEITAMIRAEQLAVESQRAESARRAELETLIEAVPAAIWVAHDPECRVITGNPAAAAMMHMPADANMSKTARDDELPRHVDVYRDGQVVAPHDLPMQTAARTGRVVPNQELEFRFRDGSPSSWAYGNAMPLFECDGRVRGAISTFVDITELNRAEERLREADRRKDEFLATLAHELRNPLAPLRNGLEILRMARGNPDASERAEAMMDRQLTQMVRLIDDLLDVSRISRGMIELRIERVELSAVLENAIETSRPLIDAARHELAISQPFEPILLAADATRLAQVFANLLNNAAKYTNPGGRIWVTVERQGSDAVVRVRDNGVGIPADMLSSIFDMFAQVDRSLERTHGGLGIGLTLVKRLVEMHGGSVAVNSPPLECGDASPHSKGSEFVIRLPLVVSAGSSAPWGPAESGTRPGATTSRRILVVDDNVDSANSLAMLLGEIGNEIRTANDGLAALEAAGEFRPDVMLLDIGMPKLNGYEVARRVRAEPWGGKVFLVALTGWGQDDDRCKSAEAGFDHHLVKPVRLATLEELLATFESQTA
jgi:PAS domain S-box-containing protein